jgi:hypothetical protein
MAKRAPSMTVAQLMTAFGVSHVTIYNWGKNLGFPALGERTAGAVTRWARRNGKLLVKAPLDVLTGRNNKKADAELKRTATGRLTGIGTSKIDRATVIKKKASKRQRSDRTVMSSAARAALR